MRYFHPAALLLALAMLQPAAAAAQTELVSPPCMTTLYYSVGTVIVHFDRNCIGGNFTIYRSQEEGEFPYYSYDPVFIDEAEMHCPLIEGDYKLEITLPAAEGMGYISYPPISFTIQDPDMDEEQSFDTTQIDLFLDNDAEAETDVLVKEEAVLKNRMIMETQRLTLARKDFLPGDTQRDGAVDSSDAAEILIIASIIGSGGDTGLYAMQQAEFDVNGDGKIDAADASDILSYAADRAAGNYSGNIIGYLKQEPTE